MAIDKDTLDLTNITLVASDLDGTLVSGEYNEAALSQRSIQVLQALERLGVQIVLASGRPPRAMLPVLDLVDLQRPIALCCNGAIVLDHKQKAIQKSFAIAPEHVLSIVTKVKEALGNKACIGVESGMRFRCEQGYAQFRGPHNMNHPYDNVESLDEFIHAPVEKMVILHTEWDAQTLHHHLASSVFADPSWQQALHLTYSNPFFIEISATGVSKGTTLAQICADANIAPSNVIAFGDMPNDIQMLQFAGIGVAMGNAEDQVKKVADRLTDTNVNHGVAQILEQILAQKQQLPN
ncbi:HAD-like domain-containing protein [Gongronella butleri]|nr:HAD-like domain-containing protein [Gongronella butleri]